MIKRIIDIIKATQLPVESINERGIKVRGFFKGAEVVISTDHYQQKIVFVSRSFPDGYQEYSYPSFLAKYAH